MSNELSNAQANTGLAIPDYMQEDQTLGQELIGKFVKPSRIKMIQKQAGEEWDDFSPGDCVVTPQNTVLCTKDEGFITVTPLFFFPEWCCWNPYTLKETLSVIRERSFDPTSELAKKAKAFISEPCPERPDDPKSNLRYCEHLNFIMMIHGVESLDGVLVAKSFVRGEYKAGSAFLSLIQMSKAPIFGRIFEARVSLRRDKGNLWYGLDFNNPSESPPFIQDKDVYDNYKQLHLQLAEASIQVDFEEAGTEAESTDF